MVVDRLEEGDDRSLVLVVVGHIPKEVVVVYPIGLELRQKQLPIVGLKAVEQRTAMPRPGGEPTAAVVCCPIEKPLVRLLTWVVEHRLNLLDVLKLMTHVDFS